MLLSNPTLKVIRTALSTESRKIGEGREDIERNDRGAQLLAEMFPDVCCETAPDGTRFIALQEVIKIVAHCTRREQQARSEGFTDGKNTGLQEGRSEAKKVFDSFSGAVNDALSQREALLRDAESRAMDIILKIAHKVTCDAARVDVDVNAAIIKGAINELADKRKIDVRVNPDHLDELRLRMDEFKSLSTDVRELRIEPDPRIGYGGCFIHTPSGDIDARLESQLGIVEESIRTESS